ncbi:Rdx family protein [Methanococcus maripaludis]
MRYCSKCRWNRRYSLYSRFIKQKIINNLS